MWDKIIRLGLEAEPSGETPFDRLPAHQLAFIVGICACGDTGYIPLLALNLESNLRPQLPICPCGKSRWTLVNKPVLRQEVKRIDLSKN